MRLLPGAGNVRVRCIHQDHLGSRWFLLSDGYVDVQGAAFTAYYCAPCAATLRAAAMREDSSRCPA